MIMIKLILYNQGHIVTWLTTTAVFGSKELLFITPDGVKHQISYDNLVSVTAGDDDSPHAGDYGFEFSADDINMPEEGLP